MHYHEIIIMEYLIKKQKRAHLLFQFIIMEEAIEKRAFISFREDHIY